MSFSVIVDTELSQIHIEMCKNLIQEEGYEKEITESETIINKLNNK